MKRRVAVIALLVAGSAFAFTAHAGPPEGKGPGHDQRAGHPGQSGNNGQAKGRGNQDRAVAEVKGQGHRQDKRGERRYDDDDRYEKRRDDRYGSRRGYDDHGRYHDYFDDRRDRRGHYREADAYRSLVDAGITAALAREYAHRYGGFDGYSRLPPGIRMNLARGKPLPSGIAKKLGGGAFRDHLPRYSGYEWQTAGTDLILVSIATGVIADILYDVFD